MNTNDMLMIDGEPDTRRRVRPVPREGVGNLPLHGGKAPLPYPTVISLIVLFFTMLSYLFMETAIHLFAAGFLLGLGYGILQPLFQSFVTGTTPAPKRGAANATYLLSYDIGIGIGSFVMGMFQESIGLSTGFAVTALAYAVGGIIYAVYVDRYYTSLTGRKESAS